MCRQNVALPRAAKCLEPGLRAWTRKHLKMSNRKKTPIVIIIYSIIMFVSL